MSINKHTSKVETWDHVAETYLEEITDSEEEIANSLIHVIHVLFNQISGISAIELGSGSGHLSTILAKQGVSVTLLDFSPKSLAFAKKIFSQHNVEGNYICQDLFDLCIDESYDIAWNCGVLEHFNDNELDEIIRNLTTIHAKYFIFIVPNATAIPYLLYRHNMDSNNEWIWGREFLRTDYIERFEKENFKYIDSFYVGKKFTEYTMNVALKKNFSYAEAVENGIAMQTSNALIGFIFKIEGEPNVELSLEENNIDFTELKTSIFEFRNRLDYASDIINTLHAENDEKEQTNIVLKTKLENYEKEIMELHNECNILNEEKSHQQKKIQELEETIAKLKMMEEEKFSLNDSPAPKSIWNLFKR